MLRLLLPLSLALAAHAAAQSCAHYSDGITSPTQGTISTVPFGSTDPTELTGTFTGPSQSPTTGGMFFDVNVTTKLYLTGIDINESGNVGTTRHADVFLTPLGGTSVGNHTNPAAFPLGTAARLTSQGPGQPTTLEFAEPLELDPGTYGFAIGGGGLSFRYTANVTGIADGNLAVSDGAVSNNLWTLAGLVNRMPDLSMRYRLDGGLCNTRYQLCLRQADLPGAGEISGLAFPIDSTGTHWSQGMIVRMSHVPAGHVMSSDFATNTPQPQTLAQRAGTTFHYVDGKWDEIGLDAAFNYDGVSDLVIELIVRGSIPSTGIAAGCHIGGNNDRAVYSGWTGATPTTAQWVDQFGIRCRLSFECGRAFELGTSCGRLEASHVGTGVRGTTVDYNLQGLPNALTLIAVGGQLLSSPIDLSLFAWTNCRAFVSPITIPAMLSNPTGLATIPLVIPNDPMLDGLSVYGQWFQLDSSEPGELTFSNVTAVVIGVAE